MGCDIVWRMERRQTIDPERRLFGPTLAGLMALYESNYARMCRLVPQGHPARFGGVSQVPADLPLHLSVIERCRYTTTYHLTYYFAEAGRHVADPDVIVRVYHDTRQAEAIHVGDNSHLDLLRQFRLDHRSALRRRWERNLLINKWIRYCLDKGHGFLCEDLVT